MENGDVKKFDAAELVVGGIFTFGVDCVCGVIDFIPVVGLMISPVIQGFTTFAVQMWFRSKGDKNSGKLGRQIAKYAANFLPVLPTNFTVFMIEAFIHNHPQAAKLTGQVAGTAVGAALGGPAGARIGAAAGEYAMGGSVSESVTDAATPAKINLKK